MSGQEETKGSLRWRRLGLGMMALALLLLGLGIGAYFYARAEVAAQLHAQANKRGVELQWRSHDLGLDRRVVLEGVELKAPQKGLTVRLDRVEAQFEWAALTDAAARWPTLVVLDGLDAQIDAAALKTQSTALTESIASEADKSTGKPWPTLELISGKVRVTGLPLGLGAMAVEGLGGALERKNQGWGGSLNGQCTQGCGQDGSVRLALEHGETGTWASARWDHPMNVVVPLPQGPQPLAFKGLKLSRGPKGVEVVVSEAIAALSRGAWSAQINAPRLTATGINLAQPDRPQTLLIEGPTIALTHHQDPSRKDPPPKKRLTPSPANAPPLEMLPGQVSKALERVLALTPEQVQGWAAQATAAASGIEVRDGALQYNGERFEGIHVRGDDGSVTVGGRWQGGLSLTLRKGSGELEFGLEDMELSALNVALGGKARLEGRATGTVTLVPGHRRQAPALAVRPKPRQTPSKAPGLSLKGTLTLQEAALESAPLAQDPIAVPKANVDFELEYIPTDGSRKSPDWLALRRLALTLPSRKAGAQVVLNAALEARHVLGQRRPMIVATRVWLDEVECVQALEAIPENMIPELVGQISAKGRFAPDVRLSVDMKSPEDVRLKVSGLPGSCVLESLGEQDPTWLNTGFAKEVKEGVSREGIKVGPGTEHYVPLHKLPAHVGAAAYLSEEAAFRTNRGFALGLIRRAIGTNLKKGRYVYGGSSVSQQLVKNLFLTRKKTLSRKLTEALIVWRMESVVSKDRILELYLNCIEFGPDLYGIGRASWHYFNKPAWRLLPLESSFLAAIKPAPWYGQRFLGWGHSPSKGWWRDRLEYIMIRLEEKRFINKEALEEAAPYVVPLRGGRVPKK